MPIYNSDCTTELGIHYCNPCPENSEREFARTRSSFFVFSDYYATLIANPTSVAVWTTGIQQGKIIVIPETSGSYEPGAPKELKGYGDRPKSNGPRTMTLNFNDPNYADNYEFYNSLSNQTELIPGFRTSSKLRIFDTPANIIAKDPVADDLEEEVVWQVTATVISNNLPSVHNAANLLNTIFKCSYLNEIPVDGGGTTFDTTFDFTGATADDAGGVSGVVSAANATQKFKFDVISGAIGLPNDMTIKIGGVEAAVITFPAEYAGESFSYVHTDETVHAGVFTNGIVNI